MAEKLPEWPAPKTPSNRLPDTYFDGSVWKLTKDDIPQGREAYGYCDSLRSKAKRLGGKLRTMRIDRYTVVIQFIK